MFVVRLRWKIDALDASLLAMTMRVPPVSLLLRDRGKQTTNLFTRHRKTVYDSLFSSDDRGSAPLLWREGFTFPDVQLLNIAT